MIFNHPGPWQQFSLRSDNRGLSTMELKSKYINEQYLFEAQIFNLQQQHNVFMNGGGGGELSEDTPTPPPIIVTLPLITNLPVFLGGTAQTNNGTWDNSPTSFTYQWTRENINIIGATSNSYVLTEDDIGSQIRCVITAINEGGSTSATTSNNVFIE